MTTINVVERREPLRYRYPVAAAVGVSLLPGFMASWVAMVLLGFAHAHWFGRAARIAVPAVPVDHSAALGFLVGGVLLYLVPAIMVEVIARRHGATRFLAAGLYLLAWLIFGVSYLLFTAAYVQI